ncbi:periplasmic binding protein-like I [Helicostylum pulchrum]|nr:periplasmic binding protein-like I [Helicostylum pulchrum]
MNSSADIKTVLKIGLLLPFHNNQTQAAILGGISGVRLAAVEINSLEIIPGAIVTLIEKDAYPTLNDTSDMAQAIFSTVSLLQQGVIGVIGDISSSWTALSALMTSTLQIPQCSFSVNPSSLAYKSEYFFRTAPTDLVYTNVILSFIMGQNWSSFGILNTDTDPSQHLTQALISKSKKFGMQIKSYQTFYDTGDTNNIHASIDTLMSFGSRVIVIATKEIDQIVTILTIAAQSGHIRHETVWITMANVQLELQSTISTFNRIVSSRSTADTTIPTFFKNAIEKTAWTTNVSSINYKTAFAGGIFTFESETNLTGYLPYDSFYQNKVET